METFNIEVYAYPIGSIDWNFRKSFYFKASNLKMEKRGKYFIVKITASEFPLEHYKTEKGAYGCRRAEDSISDYAKLDGNVYIFSIVQSINFKGVWD